MSDVPRPLLGIALAALTLSTAPLQAGVVVLAGGGSEGDIGDTSSWSYRLYGALLEGGDVNSDGEITVAILSSNVESDFLPDYFEWLGADRAFNVWIPTRASAEDSGQVDVIRLADAIFIKGGDQGVYYDNWNDTRLEENIRLVVEAKGGAIGGTSAGAMSQAEYAFAGGTDLISLDILEDATTPYLDDTDGGSAIHDDFLGFIPGVIIDTHYTARGRLGRLAGIMAKTADDTRPPRLLALGIEEKTGLIIQGDIAEVVGLGSVDFLHEGEGTSMRRKDRRPLIYTDLVLDRLTEGWSYDLYDAAPLFDQRPAGAQEVSYGGDSGANAGALTIFGDDPAEVRDFTYSVNLAPLGYEVRRTGSGELIRQSLGIIDAQDSDRRGSVQESIFRALYDLPDHLAFLVTDSAKISRRCGDPDLLEFGWNAQSQYRRAASIVIDGQYLTYKGLSPYVSVQDNGSGTLKAAALTGLRVHILADTRLGWPALDSNTREVIY